MPLITGEPIGLQLAQNDLFIEGAPNIWVQSLGNNATPLNDPDGDGFFWGMSGTTADPAISLGCITDVSLADNLTVNDVQCDTDGVKDTIQRRNYIEFVFQLQTLFPLTTLRDILHTGAITSSGGVEKVGIGDINQQRFLRLYAAVVYDPNTGDYLNFTLHKAKFVDAWTIAMRYGEAWQIQGLRVRAFAETTADNSSATMPAAQKFATIIRADPSLIT